MVDGREEMVQALAVQVEPEERRATERAADVGRVGELVAQKVARRRGDARVAVVGKGGEVKGRERHGE